MMATKRSRRGDGSRNATDTAGPSSSSEVSSPEVSTPPQEPLPSGLSALIQAATSQLSHLAEAASILQQSESSTYASLPSAVLRSSGNSSNNFPERLMGLCCDPVNLNVITFLPDGKFFAVRHTAFEETILQQAVFCGLSTCTEFLALAEQWGFSTFKSSTTAGGITILRHPKFVAGDYEQCRTMIRYGETPEAARVHALPERARSIVTSASPIDTATRTTTRSSTVPTPPKRRLSPRRETASIATAASKQRVQQAASPEQQRRPSPILQDARMMIDEDSVRNVAKAIAADKIPMQGGREASSTSQQSSQQQQQTKEDGLVETAVTSATQEIVSEAIESLLRDEGHSKETFLKHEKELSRSSIPGVVPVCKQLFSSTYKDALSIIAAQTPGTDQQSSEPQHGAPREVTTDEQEEGEDGKVKVLQEASANSATAVAARPLDV